MLQSIRNCTCARGLDHLGNQQPIVCSNSPFWLLLVMNVVVIGYSVFMMYHALHIIPVSIPNVAVWRRKRDIPFKWVWFCWLNVGGGTHRRQMIPIDRNVCFKNSSWECKKQCLNMKPVFKKGSLRYYKDCVWLISTSDLKIIIREVRKLKTLNLIYWIKHNWGMDVILDRHSTECNWQAFHKPKCYQINLHNGTVIA